MNPAAWAAVFTDAAGLVTAVTALISAMRAHSRITAGQVQAPAAGPSSPPPSSARPS